MNNTALKRPILQVRKRTVYDVLPQGVADQVAAGKTVTYNQGPRLLVARKVKHLIVFQSA